MADTQFTEFLLIGGGRVARHLRFYLSCLDLPVRQWTRDHTLGPDLNDERLRASASGCSHALLAVSDRAIAALADQPPLRSLTRVHFSGALDVAGVNACHPLMTFGPELETRAWYERIPFVHPPDVDFARALPGLHNPHFVLAPEQRAYYHALCAVAANATSALWQRIGDAFEHELALPRTLLSPLLHQGVDNSLRAPHTALTGPLARGDWEVVRRHFTALAQDPDLRSMYQSFVHIAHRRGHIIPEEFL